MAGEFVVTVKKSCQYSGSFTVGGGTQEIKTANSCLVFQEEVPANTTDYEVAFPVTLAEVQAITIDSSQDGGVIAVNDTAGGTPDNLLSVDALDVLHWDVSLDSATRFITTDVVNLFISTGSKATKIKIGVALAAAA